MRGGGGLSLNIASSSSLKIMLEYQAGSRQELHSLTQPSVHFQVAMLKAEEGIQVITSLSHDASTGLVTLPTQLSLQTLQGQGIPSFTIGGEQGQQVLVVTDPSQLEMLQVRKDSCSGLTATGAGGHRPQSAGNVTGEKG